MSILLSQGLMFGMLEKGKLVMATWNIKNLKILNIKNQDIPNTNWDVGGGKIQHFFISAVFISM